MLKTRILPAVVAMMATTAWLPCHGTATFYSAASHSAPLQGVGSGYADTYDVAVHIDGALFGGSSVEAVDVPVIGQLEGKDVRIWLSTELKSGNAADGADIYSGTATVSQKAASLVLPAGLSVPATGLYIGYTFTIDKTDDDASAEPVLVREAFAADGLYVRATRRYTSWTDMYANRSLASAMTVKLNGKFGQADMALALVEDELNIHSSEPSLAMPVAVTNYGGAGSSLGFSYSINGAPTTSLSAAAPSARMLYGQAYTVNLELPCAYAVGNNTLTLSLDAVDGVENANASRSVGQPVFCYSEVLKKLPILEEYTGLWCSYCPKGFAAMEYMNRVHPDDFIGVAFHSDDAMTVTADDNFPSVVPSYPYAFMDREWDVDPYYGRGNKGTIEDDWAIRCNHFTPVAIEVSASMAADGTVEATSRVRFIKKPSQGYRVFYYLLADGLSDPTWSQRNGFGGEDPDRYTIPEMRQFCEGDTRVKGLVFNDVVIMLSNAGGIKAPEAEVGTTHTGTYSFATAGHKSLKGVDLIAKASALKVVAGVVDNATGTVLNAAKCTVSGFGSVDAAIAEPRIVSREYHDLTGRPCSVTTRGIIIERITFDDGTSTVTKIAR